MKNRILKLVASILIVGGSGAVIHNTTDQDITVKKANGKDTVLVANPLQKHAFKNWSKRPTNVPMTIDIHHTATDTLAVLEYINKFIVDERGWAKLPYHFLIDYKGEYYFNNAISDKTYHNSKNNTKGIGIAVIGNFEKYKPNDEIICRIYELTQALDSVLVIKSIKGHRDYKATACPGEYLYKRLKNEGIFFKSSN